jgi:integrase
VRKGTNVLWVRYRNTGGKIVRESTGTEDPDQADRFLRGRLDARDDGSLNLLLEGKNLTLDEWAVWFLKHKSAPPFRSEKTHEMNTRCLKELGLVFGEMLLTDITAELIEEYIEVRLEVRRRIPTKFGYRYGDKLKPKTIHHEYAVLRRVLNVAVKKKKLSANPCGGVEFPVSLTVGVRRPHILPREEQRRIEFVASSYLRHVIIIMTEVGLRPYKELLPMQREQVDLERRIVHISDSKTESGVAEMPMTQRAAEAFRERLAEIPADCPWLFPTPVVGSRKPYIQSLKKTWNTTLEKAGVRYFPLYNLRHTFASRLSAGGVADRFVTLLLRQGDATVFKKYSHADLQMKRDALAKLEVQERDSQSEDLGTVRVN